MEDMPNSPSRTKNVENKKRRKRMMNVHSIV